MIHSDNTNNANLINEIREVNLSYLLLTQRLLRDDLASGMYQTGLTQEAAQVLISLSPAQMMTLASSVTLIAGFRMSDSSLLSMLTDGSSGGILQQARVALALAQSEPTMELEVEAL